MAPTHEPGSEAEGGRRLRSDRGHAAEMEAGGPGRLRSSQRGPSPRGSTAGLRLPGPRRSACGPRVALPPLHSFPPHFPFIPTRPRGAAPRIALPARPPGLTCAGLPVALASCWVSSPSRLSGTASLQTLVWMVNMGMAAAARGCERRGAKEPREMAGLAVRAGLRRAGLKGTAPCGAGIGAVPPQGRAPSSSAVPGPGRSAAAAFCRYSCSVLRRRAYLQRALLTACWNWAPLLRAARTQPYTRTCGAAVQDSAEWGD